MDPKQLKATKDKKKRWFEILQQLTIYGTDNNFIQSAIKLKQLDVNINYKQVSGYYEHIDRNWHDKLRMDIASKIKIKSLLHTIISPYTV